MDKFKVVLNEIYKRPGLYLRHPKLSLLEAFIAGMKSYQYQFEGSVTDGYTSFREYLGNELGVKGTENEFTLLSRLYPSESEACEAYFRFLFAFYANRVPEPENPDKYRGGPTFA